MAKIHLSSTREKIGKITKITEEYCEIPDYIIHPENNEVMTYNSHREAYINLESNKTIKGVDYVKYQLAKKKQQLTETNGISLKKFLERQQEEYLKGLKERVAILEDRNDPRREKLAAETFKTLQTAGIYDKNGNLTPMYKSKSNLDNKEDHTIRF